MKSTKAVPKKTVKAVVKAIVKPAVAKSRAAVKFNARRFENARRKTFNIPKE